jgi:multiple sugar transport system substrate-binding protein
MAGLSQFEKAHPDITIKELNGDIGNLPVKILLYNRLGAGWPDVTFDYQPENIASYITPNFNFPLDVTPYVPKSVLASYAAGANALCTSAGHLYCLRNDLGQNVLWYNTKLMKQFGYTLPTTWEQYEALGLQLAKQHPGYIIGSFDANAENIYLQPSQCPAHQLINPTTVRINVLAPQCTRAATMLDTLIKAGAIAKFGLYSKDMAALGQADKILMIPAASWFGDFILKPAYQIPAGEMAAAPPLRWAANSVAWDGASGGGIWMVSRHTPYPKQAVELATWLATQGVGHLALEPTFPAYIPASNAWAARLANDPFYATDPFPVLKAAAPLIDPNWSYVRFDAGNSDFALTVASSVLAGGTVTGSLPAYQQRLVAEARTDGYSVVTN